jgi:hypothetical protein
VTRRALAVGLALVVGLVAALAGPSAQAGVPASSQGLCASPTPLDAVHKDRRLRLVARLRQLLDDSGRSVALVARSGLDLARFGQRYSHAGVSLRDSPNTPWSVRQLYYACDEDQPRIFDQGLAGFLLAADAQPDAHVTLLLLPVEASDALAEAALARRRALDLLSPRYSANAHAFSTRYQNCNQWVAELLAAAWAPGDAVSTRAQAQDWLRLQGYEPHRFEGSALTYWLARFVPLLQHDDHPPEDQAASVFLVSMPVSLEAFVRRQLPATERMELCHDARHIVVRRGWQPLGPGCEPAAGDEVLAFDDRP